MQEKASLECLVLTHKIRPQNPVKSGYGTINSHTTIYITQFELAVQNVNKKGV